MFDFGDLMKSFSIHLVLTVILISFIVFATKILQQNQNEHLIRMYQLEKGLVK